MGKMNSNDWAHSLDMYQKWAQLYRLNGDARIFAIMERHRNKFPNQKKIFDQIDAEIAEGFPQ